jgi:long-chain acyl-CoA synthetase
METLLDLLSVIQHSGQREAVRSTDAYRTRVVSYANLYSMIGGVADYFEREGIGRGDRIMIWGENSPEWLATFWACVARGIEAVPVDFRFSVDLIGRIQLEARPRLLIFGDRVHPESLPAEKLSFAQIAALPKNPHLQPEQISADDVVEVVYTSGTTGAPKGVVHRHRNICANLTPFQKEINRYKRWAAPFQPIRILNLLPLSHMFGQSMGLFIPLLLQGSVTFMNELHPATIIRTIRLHRVSVVVSVPRILENLRNEVVRRFHLPEPPTGSGLYGVARKWWRYREVHGLFGWKFWAFVVGGARVDPELEEFWGRLGFVVVQGYGLTETSPVVAVNHPFSAQRGSLGKVLDGQEVQIAPDGEILVRGESVVTDGGGWLHTGDLGEIDGEGRLYYRGRKKDLIVTPEGLNVHPEDVERVLNQFPEVRESAVVAANDQVHAALILTGTPVNVDTLIQRANDQLEAHQRIRHWSIWPEEDFPRTASTLKVKRNEVAASVARGQSRPESMDSNSVRVDQRYDNIATLSSLERVELLADLESLHGIELDEEAFSKLTSAKELEQWIRNPPPAQREISVSRWPGFFITRWLRTTFQHTVMLPLFHHYMELTVAGIEYLTDIEPPVIFAANHTSHLDTIAIVAGLPFRWRRSLAPAMMQEHFRAKFEPQGFSRKEVWIARIQYMLARGLLNTYPLPQQMAGVRKALQYTSDLAGRGYCPLVYPEGIRTPDGTIGSFKPGIGMMANRLGVPIVPVRLDGLFEIYSIHHNWPGRGAIHMTIGKPLKFSPDISYEDAAMQVEHAVKEMGRGHVRSGP